METMPNGFESQRGLIFAIAYRMLGSAADAEDIVQECFVRLLRTDASAIGSVRSYVATIATRLCIDQLRAARVRRDRELTVLPEPVPSYLVTEPADAVELSQSLSYAFLLMMQRMTPRERSVFLLREVFDFEFDEVAAVLGRSEANCRQLLRRARRHVASDRQRFRPDPDRVAALAAAFAQACRAGDVHGLLAIFAEEVTLQADGGTGRTAYGRVRALSKPLKGSEAVARFLVTTQGQAPDLDASVEGVNGMPALVLRAHGRAVGVLCLDVISDRIHRIFIVNDPAKLGRLHSH